MAPTELLAEQHHRTLSQLAEPLGVRVALLTGEAARGKRGARCARRWRAARSQLVVGTHALIQEGVRVPRARRSASSTSSTASASCSAPRSPSCAAIRRPGAAHPGDDRDADPAHAGADDLRRPRRLAARRAAARPQAGAHPASSTRRARKQLYDRVKRAPGARPAGLHRLPAGRGVREGGPARRDDDVHERCARRSFAGTARVGLLHGRMKAEEKDAVMRRFRDGELARAGDDDRHRGRHRRAERDGDGDRARRALRPRAAAPAARPGRARQRRRHLPPGRALRRRSRVRHLPAPEGDGDAPPTASRSPRSTSSCAAPATSSAPASTGCPTSASPT